MRKIIAAVIVISSAFLLAAPAAASGPAGEEAMHGTLSVRAAAWPSGGFFKYAHILISGGGIEPFAVITDGTPIVLAPGCYRAVPLSAPDGYAPAPMMKDAACIAVVAGAAAEAVIIFMPSRSPGPRRLPPALPSPVCTGACGEAVEDPGVGLGATGSIPIGGSFVLPAARSGASRSKEAAGGGRNHMSSSYMELPCGGAVFASEWAHTFPGGISTGHSSTRTALLPGGCIQEEGASYSMTRSGGEETAASSVWSSVDHAAGCMCV